MKNAKLDYLIETIKAYSKKILGCIVFSDDDAVLSSELNNAIEKIKQRNYREIVVKKLAPYVRDITLHEKGEIISIKQSINIAHRMFKEGKNSGRIDCLNAIVKSK